MDLRERLADATSDIRGHVQGLLLWGSVLNEHEVAHRSEINVCIVAGPNREPQDALHHAGRFLPAEIESHRTDVRVFEQLPRYLQGAVLEEHELLWARDAPALYAYLYPYRRLGEHERHRHQLSREDVLGLIEGPG